MLTDRKITTYEGNVKELSDTPSSDGVTAEQLKAMFDSRTDNEVKESVNGIIEDLQSTTDGSSGADNVGATPIYENGANTSQGILEELKAVVTDKTKILVSDIPIEISDRNAGTIYWIITDQQISTEDIKVSPTMGIKVV